MLEFNLPHSTELSMKTGKVPMEQVNTTKTEKKRKGQRLGWSVQLDIAAMRKLIELFKLAHVQWD